MRAKSYEIAAFRTNRCDAKSPVTHFYRETIPAFDGLVVAHTIFLIKKIYCKLTKLRILPFQNNLTQVAIAFPREGHTNLIHGPRVRQINAAKARSIVQIGNQLIGDSLNLPFPPFGTHSGGTVG